MDFHCNVNSNLTGDFVETKINDFDEIMYWWVK